MREGTSQWAVVAIDEASVAAADLLTAKLSAWPGVSLLERTEIKRVLSELELQASGLAESDRSARFGELSQADALLMLDTRKIESLTQVRLRLVEAQTGVKLLDISLPSAGLEEDVDAIALELKRAGVKLQIPTQQRRLIGIMAIKSEEPGDSLQAKCRTLTALVESELHRRPEFIVLEREQLQRLVNEQNLTGIERKLRSASVLVEAGVRRTEGNKGLRITGLLHSPGAGKQHKLQVEIASHDLTTARDELVQAINEALGQRPDGIESQDAQAEAAIFAQRRDWFDRAYRTAEAAEMAEAALALAPTAANHVKAISMYQSQAHGHDSSLRSHEALLAARRCVELRKDWWHQTKPNTPERFAFGSHPFDPHIRIPGDGESSEDQLLRDEVDQLSLSLFDLMYREATGSNQRWDLLLQKLLHTAYLSKTERDFVHSLPSVVDQMQGLLEGAEIPRELTDERYAAYARGVIEAIQQSCQNAQRRSRGVDQRQWNRDELLPFWRQLSQQKDPVLRVAGLRGLLTSTDDEGEVAAKELLTIVKIWPPLPYGGLNLSDRLVWTSLSRCSDSSIADSFIDDLVGDAKREGNASPLVRYPATLFFYHVALPKERKKDRTQLVLSQLGSSSLPPAQAQVVTDLRNKLRSHLEQEGLLAKAEFSVTEGEGPWQDYVTQPIRMKLAGDIGQLAQIDIDRHPLAKRRGGEIVMVWTKPFKKLSIQRIDLAGGKPNRIGSDIVGMPKAFAGVQLAYSDDATFVASETNGFTIVRGDTTEVIDQEQGAPAAEVQRLAWCNGRLYIAYRDAFARFDPVEKSFELLASSISVEPRNAIDGRGSFFINSLIADEPRGYLWLNVQDNALPRARNGLWNFDTKTNKLEHFSADQCRLSWSDEGVLVHRSGLQSTKPLPAPWAWIDLKKCRFEELAGYGTYMPPADIRFGTWRFVKLGDHIISGDGQLLTSDGKEYRVGIDRPWNQLTRVGNGFITHYDEAAKTLWYVSPRQR